MARDLNALLYPNEKHGGVRGDNRVMKDFRNLIETINVVDCVPKNGEYTWTNRSAGFTNIVRWLEMVEQSNCL
ncbi:hypothetical protein SUGI_0143550 [Cryptomeria japonica]|nr:hypothetical protein SUGI_0143550 [Cryptomeria japonica]